MLQHRLTERRYDAPAEALTATPPQACAAHETIWLHDAETLAWIQQLQPPES